LHLVASLLTIVPIDIAQANAFVLKFHRHHGAAIGAKFCVAVAQGREDGADAEICGVAIVGRPVARMLDDGWTLEVTRLATDGAKNACSMLYSASWRVARALGYRKLVTYILGSESGVSLTAANWKRVGECGGGSWSRGARPRVDKHPTQSKIRFEVTA
jgi:hypothetical protein